MRAAPASRRSTPEPRPLSVRLAPLLLLVAAAPAAAQLPADPPAHRYEVAASLDPEAHVLDGSVDIQFRNTADRPLTELLFHLYMNAFADDETVFMRESSGQLRGVGAAGRGSIELESLRVDGMERLHAADGELVEGDRTQLSVPLVTPLEPGETVHVEVTFVTQLPPLFARAGYSGEFHVGAQFFPKLAKLEPDGSWAGFPYHGNGEFYADFARYALVLDLPREWPVGATGALVDERTEGSRRIVRFEQAWVHDTAFVTAPWLEELTGTEGDVRIRVLHPPGYGSAAERHLEVTRASLRHFGSYLGAYPYAQLTVIVPPRGAEGGAGMEYPTLFLTAGPWLAMPRLPFVAQDEVTAHELGHQWFQGMVASDEVTHPMLDEGLTEWITGDALAALHGPERSGIGLPFLALDGFEIRRVWSFGKPGHPPAAPVPDFDGSGDYGAAVYGRTSSVMETVARTWGREKLRSALGHYAERHRFGHPTPADLYASFDAIYGPWMSRRVLRPALEGNQRAALHLANLQTDHAGSTVDLVRLGEVPVPTRLRVVRTDGSTETIPLPAQRFFHGRLEGGVRSARVDPGRQNLLDPDRLDDQVGEARSTGLLARALHFFQVLVGSVGP